ncbi:MAG TPA: hypothetical protein VKZ53_13005 [Candidatus Angelobacter sp.]|nr:hypothetical protein [Candidatus Angelobacter sp.]
MADKRKQQSNTALNRYAAFHGLFTRVAKAQKVSRQFVQQVAYGKRTSSRIQRALSREAQKMERHILKFLSSHPLLPIEYRPDPDKPYTKLRGQFGRIARELGVSRCTVSSVANGYRQDASIERILDEELSKIGRVL